MGEACPRRLLPVQARVRDPGQVLAADRITHPGSRTVRRFQRVPRLGPDNLPDDRPGEFFSLLKALLGVPTITDLKYPEGSFSCSFKCSRTSN